MVDYRMAHSQNGFGLLVFPTYIATVPWSESLDKVK